jgi:AcrR family transcriptional regulator
VTPVARVCNPVLHTGSIRFMSSDPTAVTTTAPTRDGRRSAAAARRREREREILAATRALFDERGVRDAQIDDIAKAVGINRAIVYRHFTGKEELFALTVVGYLDELRALLEEAARVDGAPAQLTAVVTTFVDYGIGHPAFVDCAQTLMRRTGPELLDEISESALFRLGRAITGCLSILSQTLEGGVRTGDFTVADPTLLANTLYASGLGALQLARVGILVKEVAPGVPTVGQVSPEQVRDYLVASALALATHAA